MATSPLHLDDTFSIICYPSPRSQYLSLVDFCGPISSHARLSFEFRSFTDQLLAPVIINSSTCFGARTTFFATWQCAKCWQMSQRHFWLSCGYFYKLRKRKRKGSHPSDVSGHFLFPLVLFRIREAGRAARDQTRPKSKKADVFIFFLFPRWTEENSLVLPFDRFISCKNTRLHTRVLNLILEKPVSFCVKHHPSLREVFRFPPLVTILKINRNNRMQYKLTAAELAAFNVGRSVGRWASIAFTDLGTTNREPKSTQTLFRQVANEREQQHDYHHSTNKTTTIAT